jgi:hypothetical protein
MLSQQAEYGSIIGCFGEATPGLYVNRSHALTPIDVTGPEGSYFSYPASEKRQCSCNHLSAAAGCHLVPDHGMMSPMVADKVGVFNTKKAANKGSRKLPVTRTTPESDFLSEEKRITIALALDPNSQEKYPT